MEPLSSAGEASVLPGGRRAAAVYGTSRLLPK